MFEGEILSKINNPDDVKKLSLSELKGLCEDLRRYIIEVLSETPGHLASSLGTVELSVALHYLFDIPKDTLIWDVGHQAYSHKVLTQRKKDFQQLRKLDGLSGFPKRSESKYDCFGTGHASTSISASLGMALADRIEGKNNYHIAVIGDGSMTGGMAFEALNHAGSTSANMLVILNDNGISIDKGVGALGQYLTKITTSHTYNRVKNRIWNAMGGSSDDYNQHRNFFKNLLFSFKSLFSGKSNFFEALNFRYFGPIDGHDLGTLIKTIESLKNIQGPKLLHIITKKGKGLSAAENNPTTYHAPGLFDAKTGELEKKNSNIHEPKNFSYVAGETILDLAKQFEDVVCITPAMITGSGLNEMFKQYPSRSFDVGIAEEHAVTFSSGLAARGLRPYCFIYSSFLQRGFDQVIHDVCLQKLPVVLCIDRAGLVGEDGATHHGVFDLAYLNMIPNIIIAAPLNERDLRNMMYTAHATDLPFAIRYPRGKGFIDSDITDEEFESIPIGKGQVLKTGTDIAILSIGSIGNNVLEAAQELSKENLEVGVVDMRFLKPLDTELIDSISKQYKAIICIEDAAKQGGLASSVQSYLQQKGVMLKVKSLGIEDIFIEQGSVKELQTICKIDTCAIIDAVKTLQKEL